MTSTLPTSVAQELSAVLALGGAEAGKSIWLEPAVSVSLSWPGAAIPSTYRQGYFPSFPAIVKRVSRFQCSPLPDLIALSCIFPRCEGTCVQWALPPVPLGTAVGWPLGGRLLSISRYPC